jgi:hypothetical protein
MAVKPIPKRLLIHSVDYREYIQDDRWGDRFDDPVTLRYVRVEPASDLRRDATKESMPSEAVLFIDRVHSSPFIEPKEKSRITFRGREYEVHQVKALYAFGPEVHHYEVVLV